MGDNMKFILMDGNNLESAAACFMETFNGEPWHDRWTLESACQRLERMSMNQGFLGLLCLEGDRAVGLILGQEEIWFDGKQFHLCEFCVLPAFQGVGVGTALLQALLEELGHRQVGRVWLNTERGDGTEGFYRKRGFATNEQLVTMSRRIDTDIQSPVGVRGG